MVLTLPAFAQVGSETATAAQGNPVIKVDIYPNPAVDFIRVKMEKADHSKILISVHNILGNKVNVELDHSEEHVWINIKDLPSGYYLLAVKTEDPMFRGTYKFLKR